MRGGSEEAREVARRMLDRALRKAGTRLDRRLSAIASDVARVGDAAGLREQADLILAHAHAYATGSSTLDVMDYREDPPVPRTLAVDPTRGARGEAESLYRRARRLERARAMAVEREAVTRAERARVEGWRERLATAADVGAIGAIAEEAGAHGVRGARDAVGAESPTKRAHAAARLPYRAFEASRGHRVLVGRGAADNDALTLHHARPHDLWLHARGRAGAHVVVPLRRGASCPPDLLADAAMLAAHFSDARDEPVVEVIHAERRHVRKPKGSPAGSVRVDRERVFAVRVAPERLAELLAAERF